MKWGGKPWEWVTCISGDSIPGMKQAIPFGGCVVPAFLAYCLNTALRNSTTERPAAHLSPAIAQPDGSCVSPVGSRFPPCAVWLCACVCADVEVTDRHNQFYEKFQMRQSIGDILMHCWTLQRHRYCRRNAHSMVACPQHSLPGSCIANAVHCVVLLFSLWYVPACCPAWLSSFPFGITQCSMFEHAALYE